MLPRRWVLSVGLLSFALVPAAIPLAAQSVITVPLQHCLWHAGDNPAWSALDLDDSAWQRLSSETLPDSAYFWIRCRLPLDDLHAVARPALSTTASAAYQEYVQGNLIAEVGNLHSGHYTQDIVRIQSLSRTLLTSSSAVVALRITEPPPVMTGTGQFALAAGDADLLQALREQYIVEHVKPVLPFVVLYCVVGVVGIVQLGLFFYDRSRHDLLWLSLYCICISILRINTVASAALLSFPDTLFRLLFLLGNCSFVTEVGFFFALARRRIPWFIWGLYLVSQAMHFLGLAQLLLSPGPAHRLSVFLPVLNTVGLAAWTVLSLAPFLAFWPWNRITPRLRPLALCCFLWGLADFVHFLAQTIVNGVLHSPETFRQHFLVLFDVRAVVSGITVLVILMLLFRDQRRITEERAALAGEMASAREIQQYLIPDKLPPTPGLTIRSVYHPSREVGGDFFQVLPDPRDGSTMIVVGDVAGKGLKAGMLAALIVGAIRTAFKFTSDPGSILALLNERLQGRGLVTCLALRIDRNGNAELANAAQLPPYINGKELALDGALPLGALPDIAFPIARFRLAERDTMLFVSDGVVEARNTIGELFGFDRIAAISDQPAEDIAKAAQAHGQEDDITVLTLALARPQELSVGLQIPPATAPA